MIVPLLYKPGILRDGTNFQDEYCIDGQWIRFVATKIKKMKGQQEVNILNLLPNIIHMTVAYYNNYILYYVAANGQIKQCVLNQDLTAMVGERTIGQAGNNGPEKNWQSVKFIRNSRECIGFLQTSSGVNILDSNAGQFFWKEISNINGNLTHGDVDLGPFGISGGVIFSSPCLYFYGNGGNLRRSRTADPLNLVNVMGADGIEVGDAETYKIATDKILFGTTTRGGSNSPSFLFWTYNSVMYSTNVADPTNANSPVDLNTEIIISDISVLSSRSIVQYDGVFYWLGIKKIYVYTGLVTDIPNTINLEYFLHNIDMAKRQKVYGYKVERYNEIRWAYPEKVNANDPTIGCTRELVYNVKENSWYDTAIRRDCVTVYEGTGDTFSYGEACSNYPFNIANTYKRIWKQEIGVDEVRVGGRVNIPSFFTTPFYGLVAFNPAKTGTSIDKYIVLEHIEPDFPTSTARGVDVVNITVNYKKYANENLVSSVPITFRLNNLNNNGKIDTSFSARFMNITFSCEFPYDVGNVLLSFKDGDDQ